MAYDWQQGLQGGLTGAGTGAMVGGPWGAAIGGGLGLLGGFGGDGTELEQPEWYQKLLGPEFAPQRIPGREAEFYRAPQYPWTQPALKRAYGFMGGTLEDIMAGKIPDYLTRMGESIRGPAVAELEAGLGKAGGLMAETLAGRGLGLRGGAGQAGARALGGEFARARGGLEAGIAQQMFGETAATAARLPGQMMTLGQIAPPSQFVQPTEQWWDPGVYGWQSPTQTTMGGGDTGGFDLGAALPWLMQQQTPTQTQFAGIPTGGGYGGQTPETMFPGTTDPSYDWIYGQQNI